MHLHQIAEFAGLISAHGPQLIGNVDPLPTFAIQQYWRKTRERHHAWLRTFQPATNQGSKEKETENGLGPLRKMVAEEVFLNDMLTHLWCAVLEACDLSRDVKQAGPIAQNVAIGQMQARQAVLQWMLETKQLTGSELAQLDGVRRRCERWCDFLLANVAEYCPVSEYCFEPHRVDDFHEEYFAANNAMVALPVWNFVMAGLRLAFLPKGATPQNIDETYSSILGAILSCFPQDSFQSDGPFRSLLAMKITKSSTLPERSTGEHNVLRWLSQSISP